MIDEQTEILRVRLPKRLFADLRRKATAMKLRTPEVARVAIARGMIGLDTLQADEQPKGEARPC
jgi:hypothetical protein